MLRKQMLRVGLIAVSLAVLTGSVAAALGAESSAAGWLWDTDLRIEHAADLQPNAEPNARGYDCNVVTYKMGAQNQGSPQTGCAIDTMLGSIVSSNILVNGSNGTLELRYNPSGYMLPKLPGRSDVLSYTYPSSWASGAAIRVASYDQSRLLFKSSWGLPMQYYYTYDPAGAVELKDATGARIAFDPQSVAYSANGEWMVVLLDGGGIMLYDTSTWRGKVISWEVGWQYNSAQTKGTNLAVSNDGRFVAANPYTGSASTPQPALKVFDTQTCLDQYKYKNTKTMSNGCEFVDIWGGTFRGGPFGTGLKTQLAGVEYPRNIRFDGNDAITFDAVHNRTSTTAYDVGHYRIQTTADPGTPRLGLLGMGDSYISGEGAYYYRSGTDTLNNRCHTSWLSYPYQQGMKNYPTAKSVACSGAKTEDITYSEDDYGGQVRWKVDWGKRKNKEDISDRFIPGYANQKRFAQTYNPQTILLSIGGNDIGFSGLVKDCILFASTCHSTYEDRYELMQQIVSLKSKLANTYNAITMASPGTRVYVIGYPQIVSTAGACGFNVHLNDKERLFASQLITYLNNVIRQSATEAGVFYVDAEQALKGYRLCETKKETAAVNGLTVGTDSIIFTGTESYHPTAFGHKLLGATIASKTNNFTLPMPAKAASKTMTVDTSNPLLNVPRTGRPIGKVQWADLNNSKYFFEQGKSAEINLGDTDIAPDASVEIVLHSDPVVLYKGLVPDGGAINVTIPSDIEPGAHELHVYVTDNDGQKVDIRDSVYIAPQGDNNPCKIVEAAYHEDGSPVDVDSDGINDACDGDYADPLIAPEGADGIPAEEPFIEEMPPAPVVEPEQPNDGGDDPDPEAVTDPLPEPPVEPVQGDEPEIIITPTPDDEPEIIVPADPSDPPIDVDQPELPLLLPDKLPLQTDDAFLEPPLVSEPSNIQKAVVVTYTAVDPTQTQTGAITQGQTSSSEVAASSQPAVLGVANEAARQSVTGMAKVNPIPEPEIQIKDKRGVVFIIAASVICGVVLAIYFWRRRQSATI